MTNCDILDYFDDWKISATPRNYTQTPNSDGDWEAGETPADSDAIRGVKYSRSIAERYFGNKWGSDIDYVFVTDDVTNIDENSYLVINGEEWAVDEVDNIGEQSEAWTVGLKVHR